MALIDMQLLTINGKEVIVNSYEKPLSENTFKHICSIINEGEEFNFEGEVNEDLNDVIKRIKIAYKEYLDKK